MTQVERIRQLTLQRSRNYAMDQDDLKVFNIYYAKEPSFTVPFEHGEVSMFDGDLNEFIEWACERYEFVAKIEAIDKERAWVFMQGEQWSPNGEARPLIEAKGLRHTSMSVGDIIEDTSTGRYWFVDMVGFKEIVCDHSGDNKWKYTKW